MGLNMEEFMNDEVFTGQNACAHHFGSTRYIEQGDIISFDKESSPFFRVSSQLTVFSPILAPYSVETYMGVKYVDKYRAAFDLFYEFADDTMAEEVVEEILDNPDHDFDMFLQFFKEHHMTENGLNWFLRFKDELSN